MRERCGDEGADGHCDVPMIEKGAGNPVCFETTPYDGSLVEGRKFASAPDFYNRGKSGADCIGSYVFADWGPFGSRV